jgi:hypothetical protein
VELQIPAAALGELLSNPDALGGWKPVITDLAQQYARGQQPLDGDPTRRSPGAVLRRHVQIRDRYCIMIGCRSPARDADADHTNDHARGGVTTERNLGHACRHDHRVKHDGGWRLDQPKPGKFRWTSRLGHTYLVHPPPITEALPDPIPRTAQAPPLLAPLDDDLTIWQDGPPERDTGPPPQPLPSPDSNDDPPPF